MSTSPVKAVLINAVETALNGFLQLDDHLEQLLTPLAGKVIAICIIPSGETLYICPTTQDIQFLENYHGNVDATLTGTLWAFGWMGVSATPMHALYQGKVTISGDTQTAARFQRLFAKLDINLEHKIAQLTGEEVAGKLSEFWRSSSLWAQRSLLNFRFNLEEFLQEETRQLPAKAEADILFAAIDDCRLDIERAEARINRLLVALPTPAELQHTSGQSCDTP